MADDTADLTPDQATATLAQMRLDAHPPAALDPTTPAEAAARLQSLVNNPEWGKRLLAGHIAEGQEFARLSELADQADKVQDAINNNTPEPFAIETLGPGELNSRDRASAVAMFRDAGLSDDVVNQAMRGGEVSRAEYMSARAVKSALLGDKAWCDRWRAGGWNEQRQMLLINTIESNFKE